MKPLGWSVLWRIARRDLHVGFRGLRLLFICLFLGVATLAAIGSLTSAVTSELVSRGRTMLGGDIEIGMTQREASEAEKRHFNTLGEVSETIRMRAMAQSVGSGSAPPVLTELKGVDGAYPLYGTILLRNGRYGPLASDRLLIGSGLADKLGVRPGDSLRYGAAEFRIQDILAEEPDRLGEGFSLGPVAIVSLDGLRRTGLIQPGSLFTSKYRVRLAEGVDASGLRETLQKRYAANGWQIKDRNRAAAGVERFIENMGQFLSLIGLTALIVAGIGVSNGVSSYLSSKRASIATLKVLGGTSGEIERIYMLQVFAVAIAAIAAGLTIGALLPPLLIELAGDMLPVQPGFRIHPVPLATSALYGLLVAFIFTLPPLERARTQPAAAIFRSLVDVPNLFDRRSALRVAAAAALMIILVLVTSEEPLFAAGVLGATLGVLSLLLVLALGIRRLASRIPAPRRPLLRLALANLYRPGSQTSALVVALGLALTLFVTLAVIQTSLTAEIDRTVPRRAPNQFILDIPSSEEARFKATVLRVAPEARVNIVPALRGTIVAFKDQRVADLKQMPEDAWFLRGERGITYSPVVPEGSDLVQGRWWPADYSGPPLLSLDERAADTLNLTIGDTLTVSVLGREIEARIASLRKINWDTMGFNYVLVLSPNTFAQAPHTLTATVTMDRGRESAMSRTLLAAFPGLSVIAVGDIVAQVKILLDQMSSAIIAAASVAILAGIAVLVGAIAASRQARSYDSVILKTLGATRWQVLRTQAVEYGLLAAALAAVALLLGTIAGWYVIVGLFEFEWAPHWPTVLATLLVGGCATLAIGLAGSIPLMSIRPSEALRQL